MNFVVKEFVVVQNFDNLGVLVLLEFVGVVEWMEVVLIVNFYDILVMVEVVVIVFQMFLEECCEWWIDFYYVVFDFDVVWWQKFFLRDF